MGFRTWLRNVTGIDLKRRRSADRINEDMDDAGQPLSGFRGRDPDNGMEVQTLGEEALLVPGPRPFRVVCFYTEDNEYKDHIERLRASLARFGVQDHRLVPVAGMGSWEINCAFKAKFVRCEWGESDVPVVWIDADATLEAEPALFPRLDVDFAIHKWNGYEFASGTLYFGKTPAAEALLDQWVRRCEADPRTWDQKHLQSAWRDVSSVRPLKTAWLPRSYYAIFDQPSKAAPVVKHWQASRASRKDGRKDNRSQRWRNCEFSEYGKQCGLYNVLREVDHARRLLTIPSPDWAPREIPAPLAAATTAAVAPYRTVLDARCGFGSAAAFVPADRYIGVDDDPAMIMEARRRHPEHTFRLHDDLFRPFEAEAALLFEVEPRQRRAALETLAAAYDTLIVANRPETADPVFEHALSAFKYQRSGGASDAPVRVFRRDKKDTRNLVDYRVYWMKDAGKNIIPLRHGTYPEGYDVVEYLREALAPLDFGSVLDFGCGVGRISRAFAPERYVGVDLNEGSLIKARAANPGYRYEQVSVSASEYPAADLGIAYTVFLHMDDDTLRVISDRLFPRIGRYFAIAEILGHEWRRGGLPPVFNRELSEYAAWMRGYGFDLLREDRRPYKRYVEDPAFASKRNKDISLLLFRRQEPGAAALP